MILRTIAVILDRTDRDDGTVAFAAELANRHGAGLIGVLPMGGEFADAAYGIHLFGADAAAGLLQQFSGDERAAVAKIVERFAEATGYDRTRLEFQIVPSHGGGVELLFSSSTIDLLVLGEASVAGNRRSNQGYGAPMALGVPFLVVPSDWEFADRKISPIGKPRTGTEQLPPPSP